MGNITGANSILQAGIDTWGNTVSTTTNINFTSESLTFNVNRTDEGNLMAKKAALPADVTSMNTSGSVSTILRPSMVDWLMKAVMNKQGVSGTWTTTVGGEPENYPCTVYTLSDPANTTLYGSTLRLSRGGQKRQYDNVVLNNLTITATAQDYVKADFDVTGGAESDASSWSPSAIPNEKSFKCTHARLFAGSAGTQQFDYGPTQFNSCGEHTTVSDLPNYFDVSEATITIDTGLVETPALYCSGNYPSKPSVGQRSITVNFTLPYSDEIEDFYKTYYRNENAPQLSLGLVFTANRTDTSSAVDVVEIVLPYVQINTYGGNVDGTGLINSSISGNALSPITGQDEPIIVYYIPNVANA